MNITISYKDQLLEVRCKHKLDAMLATYGYDKETWECYKLNILTDINREKYVVARAKYAVPWIYILMRIKNNINIDEFELVKRTYSSKLIPLQIQLLIGSKTEITHYHLNPDILFSYKDT